MALETNLQKLEKLLSLMDSDTLTKEDFVKSFESVVKLVKRIESNNLATFEGIIASMNKLEKKLKSDNAVDRDTVKKEVNKALDGALRTQSDSLNFMRDKVRLLKDGVDADEERVVTEVLSRIPEPEPVVFDTPEELRDKIEEVGISVDAIDGLEKKLDELKKGRLGNAIGPSVITPRPLSNITPTGTINGSNTEFGLPKAPKKDGERVYQNGVRMRKGSSNDYTVAGKTITFNTAPLTDDIILVDIDF